MYEGGIEQDEHCARYNVDEHDAEHVVDAEVDVLVPLNERLQLPQTSRHIASVVVHHGRKYDRSEASLSEAECMRHDGSDEDADDGACSVGDGAETTRRSRPRVADAHVALDGQQHCQPDRRRVEYGRHVVDEALVQKAPSGRHPVAGAAEHVEVDIARERPDSGQRGSDGQSYKDDVGRTAPHVRL